jgi:hypothetical protein
MSKKDKRHKPISASGLHRPYRGTIGLAPLYGKFNHLQAEKLLLGDHHDHRPLYCYCMGCYSHRHSSWW